MTWRWWRLTDGFHRSAREPSIGSWWTPPARVWGVLRRRADARWRTGRADVEELADLQVDLLTAAAGLVRPGGLLFYSVCTLTSAETTGVDRRFREATGLGSGSPLGSPWRPHGDDGTGGLLLPQDLDSEGMAVFRYRIG